MTYDFALDKKAVISLIVGSVAIAALLFVAGLLVGRQWLGTDSVAVAHAAENERAALPTEPVLNEDAAAPAAPKAKPALPLPKQAGETPAMPTTPAAPVAVPANVPAPQVVSEAAIENADPSAASAQPAESD